MRLSQGQTLSEVLQELKMQGYVVDFNLKTNCWKYRLGPFHEAECDFEVDEVYRFDEMADPSDQSVLFAISSKSKGVKGTLVNGYGISSDPLAEEVEKKLLQSRAS